MDKMTSPQPAPVTAPLAEDPYGDIKVYHMVHKFAQDNSGRVSPLCAKKPKALDMKRNVWTIRKEAVTCKKCLKKLG